MTINDILDEIEKLQHEEFVKAENYEDYEPIDLYALDLYTSDGEVSSLITKVKFDGFNETILLEEFDAEMRKKGVIR